jgi:DNA-binding MarR family transcriptional regulator
MRRKASSTIEQTADRLHSLAIHLLRRVRRTDTETGLSPARASALSVLVFGGTRTIGELAAAEQVSAPTMTRLVAGLEADGFVKRTPDARDRRVTRVSATAIGRRVLDAGRARRIAQVVELLERLSPGEQRAVSAAVACLEAVLE